MSQQRWRITVGGRVQGVFYRASALEAAQRFGVTGTVRNLRDGQVEVVAEGSLVALQAMLDWCREGPPSARVDSVAVVEERATGEFPDFDIAPTER